MKWKNLKDYKCPKCSKDLKEKGQGLNVCDGCDFKISNARIGEIITKKKEPYKEPDRSNWE